MIMPHRHCKIRLAVVRAFVKLGLRMFFFSFFLLLSLFINMADMADMANMAGMAGMDLSCGVIAARK